MGLFRESIATTSAGNVVGKNLVEGYEFAKSTDKPRRLQWIIVAGCGAVDQFIGEVYYGSTKVGEIRNTLTGTATSIATDARPFADALYLPAGQDLKIIVKQVFASNPIILEGNLAVI